MIGPVDRSMAFLLRFGGAFHPLRFMVRRRTAIFPVALRACLHLFFPPWRIMSGGSSVLGKGSETMAMEHGQDIAFLWHAFSHDYGCG